MFKDRLISSLIGSAFYIFFQPFGLGQLGNDKWLLLAGLCLLQTVLAMVSEFILTFLLKLPHELEKGKSYLMRRNGLFQLINIPLITVVVALYLHHFACRNGVDNTFGWANLFRVFCTVSCCSFLIGLYWRNYYGRKESEHRLEDAMYLNGILQERQRRGEVAGASINNQLEKKVNVEPKAQEKEPNTVASDAVFSDNQSEPVSASQPTVPSASAVSLSVPVQILGSTKESVTLLPSDFIYAESDANYVHIYYFKDGMPKEVTLRSSITQVEEIFRPLNSTIRCHRAYVVNLHQIVKIDNHDHSLRLSLNGVNGFIPVSKTYLQVVKERIVNA